MPRDRDEDVDRLYQLPLAEFTAARNALARARDGKTGVAVKALAKPSLPAWAVNQLYWQRPKAYAALVKAAERLRATHGQLLSGGGGDVAAAEAAHRDAVRAGLDEVRAILRDSGEPATASTIAAVTETLQALPGEDPPGRLTKPLRPRGFEALAGLVPKLPSGLRAVSAPPRPATPASRTSGRAKPASDDAAARRAAAEAKRAAHARRREKAAVEKDLRAARHAERQAVKALDAARRALADAERRHDQLRDQLQFALKQIQDSRDEIARQEQRRRERAAERERLESRLETLAPSGR